MKSENNVKKGLTIKITLIIIAFILIIILACDCLGDANTLSSTDKLLGLHENEMSLSEKICSIIVFVLLAAAAIVDLLMCNCPSCGRHIRRMNVSMNYCPYCSKSFNDDENENNNEKN